MTGQLSREDYQLTGRRRFLGALYSRNAVR
jgi:hypothetical protein